VNPHPVVAIAPAIPAALIVRKRRLLIESGIQIDFRTIENLLHVRVIETELRY
tara:strand:- start:1585 stop:1743 length:159 start_codon:yes stop_codon:yes gene_type:complete